MHILGWPLADVPGHLLTQVQAMRDQAWPGPAAPGLPIHDPALSPWLMALVARDEVLASLAILSKSIVHSGLTYRAAGLSNVVTRDDVRGRGHGHRLVAAAHARMAGQYDLGIFTCDTPLQRFYEHAGWRHLPGTALDGGTLDEPLASDREGFDKVTMADFFTAPARAHRGDFVGARVALYPGPVDRLW